MQYETVCFFFCNITYWEQYISVTNNFKKCKHHKAHKGHSYLGTYPAIQCKMDPW